MAKQPMKDLPPYPTNIDPEMLTIALNAMRGVFPDPQKAVHALYALAGFVLGKVFNDPSITPGVMFSKPHDMQALPPGTWLGIFKSIVQALLVLAPLLFKEPAPAPAPVNPIILP